MTLISDDELHPVFDFEPEVRPPAADARWRHTQRVVTGDAAKRTLVQEVNELWARADTDGDGLVTRPRMSLLIKWVVEAQKRKLMEIVTHKQRKEEEVVAGAMPILPKWIQWGVQLEVEHLVRRLQVPRAAMLIVAPALTSPARCRRRRLPRSSACLSTWIRTLRSQTRSLRCRTTTTTARSRERVSRGRCAKD
jgi:hypothetical protein